MMSLPSLRSPSLSPSAAPERGAVLLVALIVMAVLALGLASYLNLNLNSARMAQRNFQGTAAFNLAETGAEEALWSINRANAGQADAWADWTMLNPGARRRFTGFDLGNATGSVKVYVDNHQPTGSARPHIVAFATVESDNGTRVSKMIEVWLRRRSRFSAGLLAKESITFAGNNASVDSWNSDPDNDPSTPAREYPGDGRSDGGTVASVSIANTAVLVNNADIFGYVFTGGSQPEVGKNGSITGKNTPAGVKIDTSRISTDFSATFPNVPLPLDGEPLDSITSTATLGTPGTTTKWRCPSISLSGKQTLTIHGDVILVLTAGSGNKAIEVTGQASILITENASLTVYTDGDVLIAGNGIGNANARTASFQLYGTNTSVAGHAMQIAGNGALKAAVYAPNADVKINGNGDVMGSIVARNITLTGNAAFHYDEALSNLDTGTPFGIDRWRELTSDSDRGTYEEKFNGW